MTAHKIIGVRFIGRSAQQEDPMYRTGMVWQSGQTINILTTLAEPLLRKHPDLFEEAPVDANSHTILGVHKDADPIVSMNINAMSPERVRQFIRMEFGRMVDPSVADEDVHQVALNIMLDNEPPAPANARRVIEYPVTDDEYYAIHAGLVELRLVPVVAPAESPDVTEPEDGSLDAQLAAMSSAELKAFAGEHGIKLNGTWGDARRRVEILKAMAVK